MHRRTTLSACIFASKACINNRKKKNLLNSNISSTCPHNLANFSPLAAEISSVVWGTLANFNGFCVLAALLHSTVVVGISQTTALNRGRHLYLAGRPSRWALTHILVCFFFNPFCFSHSLCLFSSFVHAFLFSTRVVPLHFQAGGD